MRLFVWCFICAGIALVTAGCGDSGISGMRGVLEVHCLHDTGFDDAKLCLQPHRPGAELEIRVNAISQKVQITVRKNDGEWFKTNLILDGCAVVDTGNWKCTEVSGEPDSLMYVVTERGMWHGRYYRSYTGCGPPNYYASSISGLTFWLVHFDFISVPTAMTMTGYSAQALRTFSMKNKPPGF